MLPIIPRTPRMDRPRKVKQRIIQRITRRIILKIIPRIRPVKIQRDINPQSRPPKNLPRTQVFTTVWMKAPRTTIVMSALCK